MKNVIKIGLACAVVLMVGCATGRSPVSPGFVFTSVSGSESVGPSASASKKGSSCAVNILGIVALGDASIHSAAKDAGITQIGHVDYSTTSLLGLFASSCTEVWGE